MLSSASSTSAGSPSPWLNPYRFIFIRRQVRCQDKAPVQLDLFKPIAHGYEFKVIVTDKSFGPRKVVAFHVGRGSQEGIFAELKSHCQIDHVPVTKRVANQLYLFAGILARNLTRELQIQLSSPTRGTSARRAALWCFREIETLRRTVIQRAGRIIRPAGKLVLSMNSNEKLEKELMHSLGGAKGAWRLTERTEDFCSVRVNVHRPATLRSDSTDVPADASATTGHNQRARAHEISSSRLAVLSLVKRSKRQSPISSAIVAPYR